MKWQPSETLALARQGCATCLGLGVRLDSRPAGEPCNCVLRTVFRACHNEFRRCVENVSDLHAVRLSRGAKAGKPCARGTHFSRPQEEYAADFVLVSKRVLGADAQAYQIFKFYFLLGADGPLCCRRLGMDRGVFYHRVYEIEAKLGRAFAELAPYPLFPPDQYRSHPVSRARKASQPCQPSPSPGVSGVRDRGAPGEACVRLRPPIAMTRASA